MSNIEVNIMQSSNTEILSPSAELMYRTFSDLKNGKPRKIALESRGNFVGLQSSRRYYSMPNLAVRSDFAGVASDVEMPSAPTIDSSETDSGRPPSDPAEIIVANYASPKYRYYISPVNTALKTPTDLETELPSESSPPVSTPSVVSLPSSVNPPPPSTRRSCSMPNIAVWFRSDDVEPHVPSSCLVAPSEQTAAVQHAESSLLDATEVNPRDETAEPETEPAKPVKRRSVWKRTKRFVRRLLCCSCA